MNDIVCLTYSVNHDQLYYSVWTSDWLCVEHRIAEWKDGNNTILIDDIV